MEKFLVANGCALRVRDEGKGRAVVLLHGYLGSIESWDAFAPYLVKDFRLISIDIPGHGISQVVGSEHSMEFVTDVLRGVLDELKVDRCTLVGHSMGGYAALAFLERYPERVSGIVLFHSTPNPDTAQKKESREREIAIVESGKKEVLAIQAAPVGFAPQNRKRFAHQIEEAELQASLTDDAGVIALLRGMMHRPDRNEVLRSSKVPTMMIFGRADEYITAETAAAVIEQQRQAKIVWLENSGHMGLVEQPAEAARAIAEFIGSYLE